MYIPLKLIKFHALGSCTDEDECQTENGGCDHNCTDLPSTYACSCLEGYSLDSDDRTCNGTGGGHVVDWLPPTH